MFASLHAFYISDEWRSFRRIIISERTGADGFLRDEVTGKPILKAFDIILHHKTPLTPENVNDFSISLNPDNILVVSQKTHNEIHARFGYCAERKVYYVYGAPCSGKTTYVNGIKGNSDIILDIDSIWQALTGSRTAKPKALLSSVFKIRDEVADIIRTRFGRWERAYIITGGALKTDREKQIELYAAEPIFIDEPIEVCKARLATDETKTDEDKRKWSGYIDEWFDLYNA